MTAIYGFVSDAHDTAFLGADDLGGDDGRRSDKLTIIDKRFVVAVSGPDLTDTALGMLTYFVPFSGYTPFATVAALADRLLATLRELSTRILPVWEKRDQLGHFPKGLLAKLKGMPAAVNILDCQERELHEIPLGQLFPSMSLVANPTITTLPHNRLHGFAMAAGAGGSGEPLSNADANDPIAMLERRLVVDHGNYPQVVGSRRGCYGFVRGENVEVVSTYGTVSELIESWAMSQMPRP